MTTIKTLASQLSQAFETRKRDNGDEFLTLKEGSPDWMRDVCREAHGDMLPDDWRYSFISLAADHYAQCDDADNGDDGRHESVDSAVSIYTNDLTKWLGSNAFRAAYVDDAVSEYGAPSDGGIIKLIQIGQYAEIEEVYGLVLNELGKLASDDDDGDDATSDDANPFKVEGVDSDDGSRTTLAEFNNSGEAREFLNRYTARENAGNWNLIEVYDTRGDDAERLFFWERDDATA